MKALFSLVITILISTHPFTRIQAQVYDDYTSYTNQTDADNTWPASDVTKMRVDITNDNISWDVWNQTTANYAMSFDLNPILGGNASNTAWVLRFKVIINNYTAHNTASLWLGVGLSSHDHNTTGLGAQDAIAFNIPAETVHTTYRMIGSDNGQMVDFPPNSAILTKSVATETLYVELKRLSATSCSVELFSDPNYSTSTASITKNDLPSTTQNLRYIVLKSKPQITANSNVLNGIIDSVQFCDDVTSFTCPLLPIELLSFTANWLDESYEAAKLEWITESEINNEYFNIERSIDGVNFLQIDQVDGAGNSYTTLNYSMLDESPYKDGPSYYRLQQVDFDGTSSYSDIEVLNVPEGLHFINLYPNPVVINNLTFTMTSSLNTEIHVTIVNTMGQVVSVIQETISKGFNQYVLPVSNLATGNYTLKISTESNDYSAERKFIID